MDQQTYQVEVQSDFLQRLSHVAPVTALSELIWNSLDADATQVDVVLDETVFGHERIVVRDNGTGFGHDEAPILFRNLGNSWKRSRGTTKRYSRFLHGADGQGRFKAFSLGRVVTWHVATALEKEFQEFDVWMAADQPSIVHVSTANVIASAKPGVTVTIEELTKGFSIVKAESVAQGLCEMLSSYLRSYPNIRVTAPTGLIDPIAVIAASKQVELPPIAHNDKDYQATLELVAWKVPTERFLYFCDERGVAKSRTHLHIHAPGFNVSAHLKSTLVAQLSEDGVLGLEEMHPALHSTLDRVADEVKAFHRERLASDANSLVDEWKESDVYPYVGEPATAVERIERQVFDIVASRINQNLPDFVSSGKKSKQFQLRLLRQAIEKSPEDLRRILSQVLDLPQLQRKELAELLDYVSLSGIISAARLVADRLQFLAGLEKLLFDVEEKKHLKERKQLHRMLAGQTWIFGEEFALSVDDQSLTEVLRKHLQQGALKDVDLAIPVLRTDGKRGIVDLMLSRRIPIGRESERQHLIVELKRPKVVVGAKELTQIKEYALAVARDERFRAVGARWDFWILTNEFDDLVAAEVSQTNRPAGLAMDNSENRLRVWVKTWAQVIEENRARLRFVQERLGYEPDHEDALQRLKLRYAELFARMESAEAVSTETVAAET
jgi:Histidine kinase-, DNA gyrase B-, and HSP90-like ATPase